MIKILLVEDNNEIRENTTEILEMANYQAGYCKQWKRGV